MNAYEYPKDYGPRSPSFARATLSVQRAGLSSLSPERPALSDTRADMSVASKNKHKKWFTIFGPSSNMRTAWNRRE